ncbi:tRNA (adenosine(37)-N6)-threonylcarbamoyltransferase complex dimerization subunit type 1 TsaB [Thermodesulfobacteriota bacterium]
MRILAADTATKSCSVAIVDKESLLAEVTIVSGRTHSKHLIDIVNKVIGLSGLTLSDLDGFAVTRGPGSFTGLRIGISSIKGLAVAVGKPVVGVSILDALAMQTAIHSYLICPLLDARKGEVYFSRYHYQDGTLKKELKEQVSDPDLAVADIDEACIFIGDGALLHKKTIAAKIGAYAYFVPPYQNTIRASSVAYLSMDRFEKKDTDDVGRLVPNYIRKSDAELGFGEKNDSIHTIPFQNKDIIDNLFVI